MPTKKQEILLRNMSKEYIAVVNDVIDYAVGQGSMPKLTTAKVMAPLPSAVKNQALQDAKSVHKKFKKLGTIPILRKPVCIWNNQNYKFKKGKLSFPIMLDGKSQRIVVTTYITEQQQMVLNENKLGSLRITTCNGKLVAQISYEVTDTAPITGKAMGVDLGIKCPAVAVTETGKVQYFGNGRQNKQVRRHFKTRRKKLGKAKKLSAIRKSSNKEQRWMNDQDHKVSRSIVNFAVANNVSTIKLESLKGIRQQARKSRKNNYSLSNWSFYRLANYIEYKSKLLGIKVMYVNPAYTSQTCPNCGKLNKANDRTYSCDSGYHGHRDLVGARNILGNIA